MSKFQPRILYVFGTLGTALCMALIGTFVFLEKSYPDLQHIEKFSWIPLCLVHVIWTEFQMTNLVLNVCLDFLSRHENQIQITKKYLL